MSDNQKPKEAPKAGLLTSEALRDHILDFVLTNSALLIPEGSENISGRLTGLLDSLEGLCVNVATQAIANRTALSSLQTFTDIIHGDPEKAPDDSTLYELRYRVVEQIGSNPPVRDNFFSLEEALKEYGQAFVENYWGKLGEKCPNCLPMPGDRQMWFTVVRSAVASPQQSVSSETKAYSSPSRGPSAR